MHDPSLSLSRLLRLAPSHVQQTCRHSTDHQPYNVVVSRCHIIVQCFQPVPAAPSYPHPTPALVLLLPAIAAPGLTCQQPRARKPLLAMRTQHTCDSCQACQQQQLPDTQLCQLAAPTYLKHSDTGLIHPPPHSLRHADPPRSDSSQPCWACFDLTLHTQLARTCYGTWAHGLGKRHPSRPSFCSINCSLDTQ